MVSLWWTLRRRAKCKIHRQARWTKREPLLASVCTHKIQTVQSKQKIRNKVSRFLDRSLLLWNNTSASSESVNKRQVFIFTIALKKNPKNYVGQKKKGPHSKCKHLPKLAGKKLKKKTRIQNWNGKASLKGTEQSQTKNEPLIWWMYSSY